VPAGVKHRIEVTGIDLGKPAGIRELGLRGGIGFKSPRGE
jgi:hypothetical protein